MGNVNIFTSRRTNFIECEYWLVSKDEINKDKTILTNEKKSDGFFYAKIENYIENTSSVIAQTFLFDSTSLSISTNDTVEDFKRNCIVKCLGVIWRVDSCHKQPIRANYQFENDLTLKTYIQLRR